MSERNYAELAAKWLLTNPGSFQSKARTTLLRSVAEACPVKFLGSDEEKRFKHMLQVFDLLGHRLRVRNFHDKAGQARGTFWELPLPGPGVRKFGMDDNNG